MTFRDTLAQTGLPCPVRDAQWDAENKRSNLALCAVGAACAVLALSIAVFWPSRHGETFSASVAAPQVAEQDSTNRPTHAAEQTVTRAEMSLSTAPAVRQITPDIPVSHQIRRPIRLIQSQSAPLDLTALVTTTLALFDHEVIAEDALARLLIVTLSERQSDAYIDAALNAARVRGDFVTPDALQSEAGKLDTAKLLATLLMLAKNGH